MADILPLDEIVRTLRALVQQPVTQDNAAAIKAQSQSLRQQLAQHKQNGLPVRDEWRLACLTLWTAADMCWAFGTTRVDRVLKALGEEV